jgi:hypothetical protein
MASREPGTPKSTWIFAQMLAGTSQSAMDSLDLGRARPDPGAGAMHVEDAADQALADRA